MPKTPASLWSHRDFVKLRTAQSISAFGARITREGLPMAAVMTLGAPAAQIGILAALTRGPALVVGLLAGGFVDRRRKRGLLIGMDLLRAAILATIPVAAWLHLLSMPHLYLAAVVVGAASVLFEIADHAYLPSLLAHEQLTDANARLNATDSVAEVVGPALAGALFQWLAGPMAIAFNALTYLASAGFLGAIRRGEPPSSAGLRTSWQSDLSAGIKAAMAEPRVAPLLVMSATSALFGSFYSALYTLFALRVLGLTPTMLGLTVAAGGLGGLAGAVMAPRLARRFGAGPTIVGAALLGGATGLLTPLAPANPSLGMAFLSASQIMGDCLGVIWIVLADSLRQTILPQALLGRVAATFQAVAGALGVAGALIGGALGGWIGPRETLLIAATGVLLAPLVMVFSPLRRYREA
jgi:Na+/melibiose symporter-like transporter